jgi:hypothetical protein
MRQRSHLWRRSVPQLRLPASAILFRSPFPATVRKPPHRRWCRSWMYYLAYPDVPPWSNVPSSQTQLLGRSKAMLERRVLALRTRTTPSPFPCGDCAKEMKPNASHCPSTCNTRPAHPLVDVGLVELVEMELHVLGTPHAVPGLSMWEHGPVPTCELWPCGRMIRAVQSQHAAEVYSSGR